MIGAIFVGHPIFLLTNFFHSTEKKLGGSRRFALSSNNMATALLRRYIIIGKKHLKHHLMSSSLIPRRKRSFPTSFHLALTKSPIISSVLALLLCCQMTKELRSERILRISLGGVTIKFGSTKVRVHLNILLRLFL